MKIRIQIMAMIALLIVLSLVKATDENPFLHLKNDIKANESFDDFIKKYAYGNLNFESNEGSHFYSYNNMILLLKIIEKDFKEVSRVSTIGKSYKGRDMPLVTFGLNIVRNEEQKGEHNPPSMMLTSVHHAREVVGVSMNVYTMLYLLHSFEHNDLGVKSILRMHNIYFIPFVNVDSYHEIFEKFEQTNIYSQIRKNRHYENNWTGDNIGVDLNRNYGYKFGLDNYGSSPNQWSEDYRGTSAFSEPETQNIKEFVQANNKNIKIGVNFHTWGNLFIIPFNYDNQWNKEMINKDIYRMYEDIRDSGFLPPRSLFGNGKQTIKYTANGDASDWMATQNNMMAMSPELGTEDHRTDKFFPSKEYIMPILKTNHQWLNYTMFKLTSQIEARIQRFVQYECVSGWSEDDEKFQKYIIEIDITNYGFATAENVALYLEPTLPLKLQSLIETNSDIPFPESNRLFVTSLKSLASHSWAILGVISKKSFNKLSANLTESQKAELLTISVAKYPFIVNSESSTRSLYMVDLLTSEVIHEPYRKVQKSFNPWKMLIAFLILLAVAAIIVFIYYNKCKKKSDMIKLQDEETLKVGGNIEMAKRTEDEDKQIA